MATLASPFQGWHDRALRTPHPQPHSFSPTLNSLILAVLLNALADPEGLTLAFFAESSTKRTVVVDALGNVSFVAPDDLDGILSLAKGAAALPDTGTWKNSWVIKHQATCQPNHRIFISSQAHRETLPAPRDLKLITVQGFSEKTKELKDPVGPYKELPSELWELTCLLLEARKGDGLGGKKRDNLVLDKVKSVVKPYF